MNRPGDVHMTTSLRSDEGSLVSNTVPRPDGIARAQPPTENGSPFGSRRLRCNVDEGGIDDETEP
jgi:hypothetical protein